MMTRAEVPSMLRKLLLGSSQHSCMLLHAKLQLTHVHSYQALMLAHTTSIIIP
jgi:hypothetical protein